jgi:YD repeat-containing protein
MGVILRRSARTFPTVLSLTLRSSVLFGSGHRVNISYGDSFSDGNNSRGTLAYPTTLTDADGYQSFTQYNYDFGAQTRIEGPPPNDPPNNQPNGIIQTFTYDDARRVKRATVANTGAYTHYEYGPNYMQSYSSVNTVSENPYASDSYAIQVFDGAGRVFATQGLHCIRAVPDRIKR